MKREFLTTSDGSKTIRLPQWDEQYHSKHGAIQEAKHVFIKSGLEFYRKHFLKQSKISILEIGFGTGLNALLTALFADNFSINVEYVGLEAYPIDKNEWTQLNYGSQLTDKSASDIFKKLHLVSWEEFVEITSNFTLKKCQQYFQDFNEEACFDLIYFDAFGYRAQPELWSKIIFEAMYKALRKNGVLVTYSAKGSVRRNLQELGFKVERIPGPPGKREMLRAVKA